MQKHPEGVWKMHTRQSQCIEESAPTNPEQSFWARWTNKYWGHIYVWYVVAWNLHYLWRKHPRFCLIPAVENHSSDQGEGCCTMERTPSGAFQLTGPITIAKQRTTFWSWRQTGNQRKQLNLWNWCIVSSSCSLHTSDLLCTGRVSFSWQCMSNISRFSYQLEQQKRQREGQAVHCIHEV